MTGEPGYVLLHARQGLAGDAMAGLARSMLAAAGWEPRVVTVRLEAWLPAGGRTPLVQVHRDHVLAGRWHRRDVALSAVIGGSRTPRGLAESAVSRGWGDYVLAWTTDDGRLALLRSPAGSLDAVWWRREDLTIVAHDPPDCLDGLLPPGVAIDWPILGEIAGSIDLLDDALPLTGLGTVAPGDLLLTGDPVERHPIWRPASFCRPSDPARWTGEALREVIDGAVEAVLAPHATVLAELSGGLDSAITTSSLLRFRPEFWGPTVTYHDDRPEGDERRYARAAAGLAGVNLVEVHKPVAPLTGEAVMSLPQGARPALHGLDLFYDEDMAARCAAAGATALLTGQGGDAALGQVADPWMIVDMRRRLGLAALSPDRIAGLARWTRHSAWTLLRVALTNGRPPGREGRLHPWMAGVGELPPARAGQIRRLANARLFWGDCRRARSAELLHPLMSQPVMEHCLSIPVDVLTRGFRERGLARDAFRGRVPDLILERRGKGDLSRFYCRTVLESAPFLRSWLGWGRLADAGLVSPEEVAAGLEPDALIRDPKGNRFLILALLEAWVRLWEDRLTRAARLQPPREPVENAPVHVPQVSGARKGMALPVVGQQGRIPVLPVERAEQDAIPLVVKIALDEQDRRGDPAGGVERAALRIVERRAGE